MRKGGYKIIDLKDVNLVTDTKVKVNGVYNSIENSYRKPLLISGINLNGVEKNDIFITPNISGENYTFQAYGFNFTVLSEDTIEINLITE